MKLYDTKGAPNARRVRMFLAEKGIEVDIIPMDLLKGDNLSAEFKAKNPFAKVPVLELDDGTIISESVAICNYFENTQPQPSLMGDSPLQKAQVEMWQRRVEFAFFLPVGMAFQHTTGYFKDRMTPCSEWGQDCKKSAYGFMKLVNQHLENNQYLLGDYFSIADVTMVCALDFARVVDIRPNEKHPNLIRWHELVLSRKSSTV